MRDTPNTYLVAYDIVNDRRRERIAAVLLSYGFRVQGSVFIVTARGAAMTRMRDQLGRESNMREDSIIICDLGAASSWQDRYEHFGRCVDTSSFERTVF